MDRQHGDIPLSLIQGVEIRQLLNAGCAPGRPQIDENDLPAMLRQVEGASVQAPRGEILQLLPDLVSYGRVAFPFRFGLRRRFRVSRPFFLCRPACFRPGSGRPGRFPRGFIRPRLDASGLSAPLVPCPFGRGRIQHVKPQKGKAKHRQCRAPERPPKRLPLPRGFRSRFRNLLLPSDFRSLQRDFSRADGDGARPAVRHAFSAADAFMVAHPADVHFAVSHAGAALNASGRIHPDPDDAESVKQPVNRPQRAQEAAEGAVAKDAGQADDQHDHILPGKQLPQHAEKVAVRRQKPHGTLQRAGRADVFAKRRQRQVVGQPVDQGQDDHKHRQHDILHPAERPGHGGFPDLRRWNPVEKLLDPAKGAQPSADRPAERHAKEQKDPQHIPARPVARGRQGVLQRAQRAGADRSRAGIAVQPRHAGGFGWAPVNLPGHKALQMRVIQQRAIHLDQPPG